MAAFTDKNTPTSSTGRSFPTRKGQARVQKNREELAAFAADRSFYDRRSNPNKGRFGGTRSSSKCARKPGKAFKNK